MIWLKLADTTGEPMHGARTASSKKSTSVNQLKSKARAELNPPSAKLQRSV